MMMNIEFMMFETESDLFKYLSNSEASKSIKIGLVQIGAYEVQIISPSAPFNDYFYKAFVIHESNILGISYIYSEEPIPSDFPTEHREMVYDTLTNYYDFTIKNFSDESNINYSLYDMDEPNKSISSPEPLLFSYKSNKTPIIETQQPNVESEMLDNSITYYKISL